MKCNVKNIKINYEVYGDGTPVIMLHGYYPDHRLMLGCMEPIFKNKHGYKRIYIDLPGMGITKGENWITNSDIMLDIIIQFIDKIIPNENFLLAGESYGGYLSRGVIYKMKDRVDGILLICPVIKTDNKKRNVPQHTILEKDTTFLCKLTPEEAENFNTYAVIQNEETYKRYKNEIVCGVEIADVDFLENLQEKGYEFSFNVDDLNKRFNKPALILLGKQDSCVGYKDAWNILDNFPRAAFAILDKSGHNLQIEQSKVFNCLVDEWIVRIEGDAPI